MTANERFDPDGNSLEQDTFNITSNISITRRNEFQYLQASDPQNLYYLDTLTTSINHNFLLNNDTVMNYFDLLVNRVKVFFDLSR